MISYKFYVGDKVVLKAGDTYLTGIVLDRMAEERGSDERIDDFIIYTIRWDDTGNKSLPCPESILDSYKTAIDKLNGIL